MSAYCLVLFDCAMLCKFRLRSLLPTTMAKSTAKYTLIPDADEDDRLLASPAEPDSGDESDSEPLPRASPREQLEPDFPPTVDPRFIQPTPALWKRAGVIFLTFFLFWLFFQIQASRKGSRSKVIYANRWVP